MNIQYIQGVSRIRKLLEMGFRSENFTAAVWRGEGGGIWSRQG
jgi:hypothetical protein